MTSAATLGTSGLRRPRSLLVDLDTLSGHRSRLEDAKARGSLRNDASWISKFDVVQQLGGEGVEGRGDGTGIYGQ